MRIVIIVEGGIVQNVLAEDYDYLRAVVVDYDTEGVERNRLDECLGEKAEVYEFGVDQSALNDLEEAYRVVEEG